MTETETGIGKLASAPERLALLDEQLENLSQNEAPSLVEEHSRTLARFIRTEIDGRTDRNELGAYFREWNLVACPGAYRDVGFRVKYWVSGLAGLVGGESMSEKVVLGVREDPEAPSEDLIDFNFYQGRIEFGRGGWRIFDSCGKPVDTKTKETSLVLNHFDLLLREVCLQPERLLKLPNEIEVAWLERSESMQEAWNDVWGAATNLVDQAGKIESWPEGLGRFRHDRGSMAWTRELNKMAGNDFAAATRQLLEELDEPADIHKSSNVSLGRNESNQPSVHFASEPTRIQVNISRKGSVLGVSRYGDEKGHETYELDTISRIKVVAVWLAAGDQFLQEVRSAAE